MARTRRKIGGARSYKAWKDWSEGDYVIGKYVGNSLDNYDKTNYHIELEEVHLENPTSSNGRALVKGVVLGLNSAGTLNAKMDDVEIGNVLEIVYGGTEKLPENHKFKNKDCHQIEVTVVGEDDGLEEGDLLAGSDPMNLI